MSAQQAYLVQTVASSRTHDRKSMIDTCTSFQCLVFTPLNSLVIQLQLFITCGMCASSCREVFAKAAHQCSAISRYATAVVNDASAAVRLVASALLKMMRSQPTPYDHPFDFIETRHTITFVKDETNAGVFFWSTALAKTKPQMDYVALPAHNAKYLHAIEDLGRGLTGRVWLCSTTSGRVCVLKFPNRKSLSSEEDRMDAHSEARLWHQIYPGFESAVQAEVWSGYEVLRMPHFSPIPFRERTNASVVEAIEKALRVFDDAGYVHGDVRWKNMGQYKNAGDKAATVVIYDLGRVNCKTEADAGIWMKNALSGLQETAGE